MLMPMEKAQISRKNVGDMFNSIAASYDKINRILTVGIDIYWRRAVRSFLPPKKDLILCDLATGTADQILSLKKASISHFYGYDIAEGMLSIGRRKIKKAHLSSKVTLARASALEIPLNDNSTDFVTMSFGIRNVEDPLRCLEEIYRILRPGSSFCILEFSLPTSPLLRGLYLFYLRKILPKIGRLFSRSSRAYTYLNRTIETFPYGKEFTALIETAGFASISAKTKMFGVVSYYTGIKP